jgi:hypothetical protein
MSGAAKAPITVQVVVDCSDPHALVRFWGGAFGYEIEDHHDLVVSMLEQGIAEPSDTVEIDGRKAWATAAACRYPDGSLPRLLFQTVPEAKANGARVKNSWHLDFKVGEDRLEAERDRLIAAGATFHHEGHQGPSHWFTLTDPEGNFFCIAA